MITPELVEYVRSSLAAGQTRESLRGTLLSSNWSAEDVQGVLNQFPEQAAQTPLITQPAGAAVNLVPAKKHHLSKKVGIIIAVLVLLLAGGAFAAYYFMPPSPEKIIKSADLNFSTVKTFDYSGSIVADITAPSGLFSLDTLLQGAPVASTDKRIAGTSDTKFSIDFNGSADVTDVNHPKSDVNLNFNYSLFTFGLEFRLIDKIFYLKVNQLPKIPDMDLSSYANIWIKVDPEAVAKQYGVGLDLQNKTPDLTAGQKKQIEDLTMNAHFVNKITKLADDTIDGVTTYHFALTIDKPGLISYLTQLDKINNSAGSTSMDLSTVFDKIQISNAEIWIGKTDNMIYRVSGQITELPSSGTTNDAIPSGTVNILLNFKNFNKPSSIVAPTESKDVLDVIKEFTASAVVKARDAERIASVRQLQTGLELYFNDHGKYPGALSNLKPGYLTIIPTAPTPPDGACTDKQNTYTYSSLKAGQDYSLTFCLGLDSSYPAGMHTASSLGIK
jgi:hypothetical protein